MYEESTGLIPKSWTGKKTLTLAGGVIAAMLLAASVYTIESGTVGVLVTTGKYDPEEVQLAKQEEQKLAMVEKQAEKRQRIKTIEANTRLIEITTKAKAEAEKKKIEADAKAYQIAKEAEAIAKANREIAASIDDRLIRYKWIERWSGKLPDTYLGGDKSGLMLNLGR